MRPALLKGQSNPLFASPNDVAEPAYAVALDPEGKAIGKPKRSAHLDSRAGCRKVADQAGNRAAAELDGPGFVNAMTRRSALFAH
jgi:hypothetical protein